MTHTSKKAYVSAKTVESAKRKLKSEFGKSVAVSTTKRGSKLTEGRGYVYSARWKK